MSEAIVDEVRRLRYQRDVLKDAAKIVLDGFDKGFFLRNPAKDVAPNWAMQLFPYIKAMADAQQMIERIESRQLDGSEP